MRSFTVSLLVLALPLIASAQQTVRIELPPDLPEQLHPFLGFEGSLPEICNRIASTPLALEMSIGGTVVVCEFSADTHGYRTLEIVSAYGTMLYLLHESRAWRVIRLLEDVPSGGTEASDTSLERSGVVRTFSGTNAVFFETRASYVDYEGSYAAGYVRDSITVCVDGECTQLPTRMELWRGESPNGGHAGADGFVVTERNIAHAIAVIRRSGTLRLTLRDGTWRHLYGASWLNPDPSLYPSSGTTQIVRYLSLP